jgi:hypothetical protein
VEVRKDMEEAWIKWHLWLHQDLKGANYVKPQAPYVFNFLILLMSYEHQ